jgi:hypothetical protein
MDVNSNNNSTVPAITLWISIIIFVLVTIWIIRVFNSQDNQDQERLHRISSEQVRGS